MASAERSRDQLQAFARDGGGGGSGDAFFSMVLALCLIAATAAGLYFRTIKRPEESFADQARRISAHLLMQEQRPVPSPPKPAPRVEPEKPVDLTQKPQLRQKDEETVKPQPEEVKARRVYGLRRVYSTGLGTGGSMADAVIGKLGNTINKDFDTLQATVQDLKGQVVSVTTVTSMPRLVKTVKPEYTPEMIDKKIEGSVRVKVIIDIDGRVKKAIALNDLGEGAAQRAVAACYAMEFDPATRDGVPVAVEIIVSIKFVLLG